MITIHGIVLIVMEHNRSGVPNMVWFNYRRVPAISLAKQLIDERRIGRVFHYRAKYLQDWTISPDLPQGGEGLWRLDADVAGSGVTGDLLAHSIDTAIWLVGSRYGLTSFNKMAKWGQRPFSHALSR